MKPSSTVAPFILAVALALITPVAGALPVYGEDAALTGTRNTNTGGGLFGKNGWDGSRSSSNIVNLDWRISQTGASWHYEYYFFGGGITGGGQIGATEVSHMSLDVSDNCGQAGANCVTNANVKLEGFGTLNGIVGAFKFDESPEEVPDYVAVSGATVTAFLYEFDSTRAPMWGDVCSKGGGGGGDGNQLCTNANMGNWLWNTGFSNHDSTSLTAFIAVPDTNGSPPQGVPEPGVLALLAAALVGAGLARRRARVPAS